MKTPTVRRILQAFTWWNGTTWGTSFTTWRRGEYVGKDEAGNAYYRGKPRKHDSFGRERRWVLYNGPTEASMIPPGWFRWMHHMTDTPPTEMEYTPREWEKPHQPNPTGTPNAYRPDGSILRPDPEAKISAGYDAWTPD